MKQRSRGFIKLNKIRGFTLLELMLVIALVAALSVAGLAAYQVQIRNFKIDKTAIQMQEWLQAGMAFYSDCHVWPNPNNDPNILQEMTGLIPLTPQACPTLTQPILKAYKPIGADSNGPWPNNYTIGTGVGAYANMFLVKTMIGPMTGSRLLTAIGGAIAGRLPNATSWTNNGLMPNWVVVQASVGVPGSSNQTNGFIIDMEMVNSNSTALHIKQPTAADCPPGMQAVLVSAMAAYQSPHNTFANLAAYSSTVQNATIKNGFLMFTNNNTPQTGLIMPQLQTNSTNETKNSAGGGNQNGDESAVQNQVLLISACLPNASANKINNSNNLQGAEAERY